MGTQSIDASFWFGIVALSFGAWILFVLFVLYLKWAAARDAKREIHNNIEKHRRGIL